MNAQQSEKALSRLHRLVCIVLVTFGLSCVVVDDQRDVVDDVTSGQMDTSAWFADTSLGTGGPCDASTDCLSWVSAHPCLTAVCVDGTCHALNRNDGEACTDNDPTSRGDYCSDGVCQSGPNVCLCETDSDCIAFDDLNPCNGEMRCDSCSCQLVIPPMGTACDDQNPVTWNDQCSADGVCAGTNP